MAGVDTRSDSRDSLFLLAGIRVEKESEQHRVRVRNLSDGGMMGEGAIRVQRGNRVEVELRNAGIVGGTVAWVQDQRFGVAFDEDIDSQAARKPPSTEEREESLITGISRAHRAPKPQQPPSGLRKV